MMTSQLGLKRYYESLTFHNDSNIKQLVNQKDMCYEAFRLESFRNFPDCPVSFLQMAKAGFYYENTEDETCCFCCNGKVTNWNRGMVPIYVHKNAFPDCRFLNGIDTRNVPIGHFDLAALLRESGQSSSPAIRSLPTNLTPPPPATTLQGSASLTLGSARGRNPIDHYRQLALPREPPTNGDIEDDKDDAHMKDGNLRLATFDRWNHNDVVRGIDLAKAGFFYLGNSDRVKCAFCKGILRNWEAGDSPEEEHKNHFSRCPFIMGHDVGNIPIEGNDRTPATQTPPFVGTAKHPEYASEDRRNESFRNWQRSCHPYPEQMAKAGFFYSGVNDQVKCFFCAGGLRNWEFDDDPFSEHVRWFPRCGFIIATKGQEYVQQIQQRHEAQRNEPPPSQSALRQDHTTQGQNEDRILRQLGINTAAGSAQQRPPQGEHAVQPREIKARLDTPQVRAVLDMGFPMPVVREAIVRQLRNIGDDFQNAQHLLEAVFEIEKEFKEKGQYSAAQKSSVKDSAATAQPTTTQQPAPSNQTNTAPGSETKTKKQDTTGDAAAIAKKLQELEDLPIDEETRRLIEENRLLRESRTCKVCMDHEVNVVFLPCGHLVCCNDCAPAMRDCPICRALIRGTVRTFLS